MAGSKKQSRKKLSASARARATAKARLTRCHNTCDKTGGVKPQRVSNLSSSKKRALRSQRQKNPWLAYVKKWRAARPDFEGNVLKAAAVDYNLEKAK